MMIRTVLIQADRADIPAPRESPNGYLHGRVNLKKFRSSIRMRSCITPGYALCSLNFHSPAIVESGLLNAFIHNVEGTIYMFYEFIWVKKS